MGKVVGVHGVAGWVKVHSWTRPWSGILDYRVWTLTIDGRESRSVRVLDGRRQAKGLVARVEGVADRESALGLVGWRISIDRNEMPATAGNEHYWVDLEGLAVVTLEGVDLGRVHHLIETGANDVLVVHGDRERLLPFIPDEVIVEVNLDQGWMRVNWDPAF